MKKLMFVAVASLFAVSAYANKDAKKAEMKEVAGATEATCGKDNTWKDGKCWTKADATATTTSATSTTTTAPAAAPAKK